MEGGWDAIVTVRSSEAAQLERLRARGFSPTQARQRIAAQMPTEEKARRADHVIDNDGDKDVLERSAKRTFERILGS